jgi:hypothetical protein
MRLPGTGAAGSSADVGGHRRKLPQEHLKKLSAEPPEGHRADDFDVNIIKKAH